MNRLLAHTAMAALMGVAMIAYGCARADDSKPDSDPGAKHLDLSSLPTDLDGEIRRAEAFRADGKLQEAAHVLGQLMLVAPDDPRVVSEYGKVLVLEDKPQDAEEFLKRAIQIQSSDWTVYSALGVAYDEMGDNKSAKLAYERALALNPGEPSVLNNFARSRIAAGDLVSAKQLIAQAQSADAKDATIASTVSLVGETAALHQVTRTPAKAVAAVAPATPTASTKAAQKRERAEAATAAVPAPQKREQKVEVATLPAAATTSPVVAPDSATGAPRALNKDVVMQSVPADPLAGSTGKSARAKRAAKHKSATPELRMSADAS